MKILKGKIYIFLYFLVFIELFYLSYIFWICPDEILKAEKITIFCWILC